MHTFVHIMSRGALRSGSWSAAVPAAAIGRLARSPVVVRPKKDDFSKGKRGAVVPAPAGKSRITIRIDDDVLDWFRDQVERAGGGNYQTLINAALREHIDRASLEELLRRVVREELSRV